MQGSKVQAEEGTLVILAAGDTTLFDDCQSCFQAMGKNSFYLGKAAQERDLRFGLGLDLFLNCLVFITFAKEIMS